MTSQATSPVQTRIRTARKPAPAVGPSTDQMAAEIEAGFRNAASRAIRSAHQRNVPVPVEGDAGQVAWLHPDGITRASRDPVYPANS